MSPGTVILIIILFIGVFVGVFFFGKYMDKKCAEDEVKPKDKIKSVSIISTRTGEETRVLATYNFTLYSFLVVYESGKREVVECKNGSDEFNELIKYIKVKNDTEEVEFFETIDD